MKHLLSLVTLTLMLSTISFSQALQFKAYKATIHFVETGENKTIDVNFNIIMTDYQLIVNKNVYDFTSSAKSTSNAQFYCYATDPDGRKCRIWFKKISMKHCLIGVEYNDCSMMWDVIPL